MVSESSERRRRQSARRLEDILDAAARLFAERGFHRTTTRDIAKAADVAEGTLYNYFANKNDLLFGILNRLKFEGDLNSIVIQLPPEPDAARSSIIAYLFRNPTLMDENRVMLQAILSEMLANEELRHRYSAEILEPVLNAVEKNINLQTELGGIREIDAQAASRLLIAFWFGLFILQVLDDPLASGDWDRLTNTFSDIFFDGLSK